MCSLRVPPQGLVDLTPRGRRGEAICGVWLALQVGGLNFAMFIPTPLRFLLVGLLSRQVFMPARSTLLQGQLTRIFEWS